MLIMPVSGVRRHLSAGAKPFCWQQSRHSCVMYCKSSASYSTASSCFTLIGLCMDVCLPQLNAAGGFARLYFKRSAAGVKMPSITKGCSHAGNRFCYLAATVKAESADRHRMQRSVIISVTSLRKVQQEKMAGARVVSLAGKLTRLQIFDEITG